MTGQMPPMPDGMQQQSSGDLMQGMAQPDQQKPQAPNQQEQLRNAMMQFQELDQKVGELARQYPEFSESARAVKDAIKEGMLKVIGSPQRGAEAQSMPLL